MAITAYGANPQKLPRVAISLILLVVVLFIWEIALGTSMVFAAAMAICLSCGFLTIRKVGITSLSGGILALILLHYVIVSQIAKCVLGQPADTFLLAPQTTILILAVGIASLSAGILLVNAFMKERGFIEYRPTLEQLRGLRTLCLAIGLAATVIGYIQGGGGRDFADLSYGGIRAITIEFTRLTTLGLMAETWVALWQSEGRKSTTPLLWVAIIGLSIFGLLVNSKQGIVEPLLTYLFASLSYRGHITRRQIGSALIALIFGATVLYPINQLARSRFVFRASTAEIILDTFEEAIQNPQGLLLEWQLYNSIPVEQLSAQEQGLLYLGSADDLLGRFMLIANTDVVVNAVNEKGLYGSGLIASGFLISMPTFLLPDKPRFGTDDLILWFYDLKEQTDVPTHSTTGLFADCYAAWGWAGSVILPFLMMVISLPTMQIFGTRWSGNLITCFFFFTIAHSCVEWQLEGYVQNAVRAGPSEIIKVLVLIFLANKYLTSTGGRKAHASTLLGRHRPL